MLGRHARDVSSLNGGFHQFDLHSNPEAGHVKGQNSGPQTFEMDSSDFGVGDVKGQNGGPKINSPWEQHAIDPLPFKPSN